MCDAPKVKAEVADSAIVPHIRHFFDDFASWATAVTQEAGAQRAALEPNCRTSAPSGTGSRMPSGPPATDYADALAARRRHAKADVAFDALTKIKSDRTTLDASIAPKEAALRTLATEAAPSDAMRAYWRELAESIAGATHGRSGTGRRERRAPHRPGPRRDRHAAGRQAGDAGVLQEAWNCRRPAMSPGVSTPTA